MNGMLIQELEKAVFKAIEEVGLQTFKRTSLFMSSRKVRNEYD